jgi:hypothetical protein
MSLFSVLALVLASVHSPSIWMWVIMAVLLVALISRRRNRKARAKASRAA